jgi:predicted RNA-binding Zn-ribbon protein involved in translation (DUF1610 family)
MDPVTIQQAYTGLRFAIDTIRTVVGTKTQIAADGRIADALDHLGRVQDTLFELRNELAALQEENHTLRAKVSERAAWEATAAKYALIQAPGGAMVYRTEEPPGHYACPRCFGDQKRVILQDRRVASGTYDCPECKRDFNVGAVQQYSIGGRGSI